MTISTATGTARRICRVTSMPFISGSATSRITRSGFNSSVIASACTAGGGFAAHDPLRFALEDRAHALAHELVVVGDENACPFRARLSAHCEVSHHQLTGAAGISSATDTTTLLQSGVQEPLDPRSHSRHISWASRHACSQTRSPRRDVRGQRGLSDRIRGGVKATI